MSGACIHEDYFMNGVGKCGNLAPFAHFVSPLECFLGGFDAWGGCFV